MTMTKAIGVVGKDSWVGPLENTFNLLNKETERDLVIIFSFLSKVNGL